MRNLYENEIPEGYRLRSVTVSRESTGKYFASLLYEYDVHENQGGTEKRRPENTLGELRVTQRGELLGVDYAMDGMAVFSDGRKCEYPKYFRLSAEKLAREQRRLSNCQKGSRNYQKQKRKVALCHEKPFLSIQQKIPLL